MSEKILSILLSCLTFAVSFFFSNYFLFVFYAFFRGKFCCFFSRG